MERIKRIELIFENCDICILKYDMFKYLYFHGIKENKLINCYQYEKGEIIKEKSCDEFSIEVNEKGLEQETSMNMNLRERLRNYKDITGITIVYENNVEEDILIPWYDGESFSNKYQEIEEVEDIITVTINRK